MDPTLDLQGAIYRHLSEGSPVLLSVPIYDRVPQSAKPPYVSFGPSDALSDDADCITTLETTIQLDCWSTEPGFPEVRRISDEVRRALHNADLSLTYNALVLLQHRQTRYIRSSDGLTSHAAMTFEATIEQT